MTTEQQTWAAAAVVIFTAGVFAVRLLSRKKRGGCGSGCGCGVAKKPGK